MPWVKFDDQYPDHPKVAPLTDRLYRLHSSAIFWCSKHLTDGVIRAHLLGEIRLRPRPRAADAERLVDAGLFHRAGDPPCPSDSCPPAGVDGWVIHDYWDHQPRRAQVERERRERAERQRRWRERRRGRNASTSGARNEPVDASRDPPVDALRNGPVDASPRAPVTRPRPGPPRPEGGGGGAPPQHPPAASSAGDAAGGRPAQTPPPDDPELRKQALDQARQAIADARRRARADPPCPPGSALDELRTATTPPETEPEAGDNDDPKEPS